MERLVGEGDHLLIISWGNHGEFMGISWGFDADFMGFHGGFMGIYMILPDLWVPQLMSVDPMVPKIHQFPSPNGV